MILTGTFQNRLDGKGRASLPASFRNALPEQAKTHIYMLRALGLNRLEAMPAPFFEQLCTKIAQYIKPLTDDEDLVLAEIAGEARLVPIDAAGRIVIPKDWTEQCNIKDEVVFVGYVNRFLIYSQHNHAKWKAQRDPKRLKQFLKKLPSSLELSSAPLADSKKITAK